MENLKGVKMNERSGEKIGWIGGWSGGFVWLLILVIMQLIKGGFPAALVGLGVLAVAVVCILRFAPWKNPMTPYWKLLFPIYGALFLAFAYAVTVGRQYGFNLEWRYLFWVLPMFIPFFTLRGRTWDQGAG